MSPPRAHWVGTHHRWRWIAGVLPVALLALLPAAGSAHAFLDRSDPEQNAIVPASPDAVRLWFTEPLEEQYSAARLYDVQGNKVETSDSYVDDNDPSLLVLPISTDLERGTYTVAWRNISASDGHPSEGLLTFTIGSGRDVQLPAPPETPDFGGPPTFVEAIGRWLALLGAAGVVGILIDRALDRLAGCKSAPY